MAPTHTPRCLVPSQLRFFAALSLATCLLQAQNASAPPVRTDEASAQPSPTSEVVELSPFTVQAEDGAGYQAANTTSGSRLKSRLKDTSASISPFTPEFLSDIGATSLQDMMAYAANAEFETEDATNGFNNSDGRFATSGDHRFRMRGMTAGASRAYVDSAVPVDLYKVLPKKTG